MKSFEKRRNQAMRILREFETPGEHDIIRNEEGKLVIELARSKSVIALLATLTAIPEDFGQMDDSAPEPTSDWFTARHEVPVRSCPQSRRMCR